MRLFRELTRVNPLRNYTRKVNPLPRISKNILIGGARFRAGRQIKYEREDIYEGRREED
jgi:hypothetical protein